MDAEKLKLLGTLGEALSELGSRVEFKHDLPAGFTTTTNLMHGPTGIFGAAGIDRDVFSTRVKPRGLMQYLPVFPTVDTNPIVAYLTGFRDDESGNEQTYPCDDPLEAGEIKSCLQGALFGRYERKTQTLELDQVGKHVNRGELYDLRLVNDPLLESGLSMPNSVPMAVQQALNREVLARWVTLGVAFERLLGPQIYTGNPANNTLGNGYMEFWGLETLVGTGKVDVITNTLCPALDSYIYDFNFARIDASTNFFVHMLTAWRYVNDIASRTGLDPVQFAIVMRRNLFHEVADLWPCVYNTYRCQVSNVQDQNLDRIFVDGERQRAMSDQLRNGMYLLIDGVKVPVIIDDFIPEDTNTTNANVDSGCFASDVYILPLTVRGGMQSTFLEHYNYQASNGVMAGITGGRLNNQYWTDGGRWLWTVQQTNYCVSWLAKIEPRLRLLTPHLAARIQNVQYCPIQHFREDQPNSSYFYDGGEYTRSNAPYDKDDFALRQ